MHQMSSSGLGRCQQIGFQAVQDEAEEELTRSM